MVATYTINLSGKNWPVSAGFAAAWEKNLAEVETAFQNVRTKIEEEEPGLPAIGSKAFPFSKRVAAVVLAANSGSAILKTAAPKKQGKPFLVKQTSSAAEAATE
jgi:hypothetical protein